MSDRYPFDSHVFTLRMDARAGVEHLIIVDEARYLTELQLKDSILTRNHAYYFRCEAEFEPLAWDAVRLILPDMADRYPHCFMLDRGRHQWIWTNKLLGATTAFTPGDRTTLPLPPLDWLGRQVQEDLILMVEGAGGESVCAAGHLCFASGWSLDEKLGRSFLDIHAEVPQFAVSIGRSSDLMMRRLKAQRPTGRSNWTISTSGELNQSPELAHLWKQTRHGITSQNAGERCFLRVERQTFSRLPETGGILFTIHTVNHRVVDIIQEPADLHRFVSLIRSMPVETRAYKGMTEYVTTLIAYLDSACAKTKDEYSGPERRQFDA